MTDVTSVGMGGTAVSVGSFLANVVLSFIIAIQAKRSGQLADAKVKAEESAAKSNSGDMLRAQESLLAAAKATQEAWEKSAIEWKMQHEKLSVIHEASRKDWHDRNDASNLVVLKLTEENSILKSQTNLAPIMESLERIVQVQKEMSQVLLKLANKLNITLEADEQRREHEV